MVLNTWLGFYNTIHKLCCKQQSWPWGIHIFYSLSVFTFLPSFISISTFVILLSIILSHRPNLACCPWAVTLNFLSIYRSLSKHLPCEKPSRQAWKPAAFIYNFVTRKHLWIRMHDIIILRTQYDNIQKSQNSRKLSTCRNSGYQTILSGGGEGVAWVRSAHIKAIQHTLWH